MRATIRIVVVSIFAATLIAADGAALGAQASRQAAAQLRAAQQLEEVAGNLPAAIDAYRKLSTNADRAIAAETLLRLAGCQEKLGQTEAQKTYREVIAKFSDQISIAAEARRRIKTTEIGAVTGMQSPPGPFRARPVDTRIGFGAVVSPDGTMTLEVRDGAQLIEREVATGRERVLVSIARDGNRLPGAATDNRSIGDGAGGAGWLAWSPEGQSVAFVTGAKSPTFQPIVAELRVLSRATGEMTTVVTAPGAYDFGPEAWTRAGILVEHPNQGLVLVSPDGSDSRAIPKSLTIRDQFDLTPDGKSAVAARAERLVLIDLTSGDERPISLGIGAAVPRISPDGRLVAFLSKQSGAWALYVASMEQLPIRNPVRVAMLDPEINVQNWRRPRWTADGMLAFDYETGGQGVYRVDMDSQTGRPRGRPERLTHLIPGVVATVSPDSRHIAYWAAGGGVAVMDADGSHARRLTETGPTDGAVRAWRSNDELLFVDRSAKPGTPASVGTININTGVVSNTAHSITLGGNPSWQFAPVTNEIVFFPGGNLVAHSLADGRERTVTTERLNGRISPDGKRVAASLRDELRVLAIDDAGKTTVVASLPVPEGGVPRAWSPNGAYVIFEARAGGLRIFDVKAQTSWPLVDPAVGRTLFGPDTSWGWFGDANWSPDGSFVVAGIGARRRVRIAFEGVTYDAVSKLVK